jgi:hypothetical protein
MTAGVFHAIPGLVRELAEIHLPGVIRLRQHVNVGAGGEYASLRARKHDRANLGMLEPNPLQGVVQLDVDAEVVRVELQSIAGPQTTGFVDVHR